jgi:hypothetical protein
MYVNIYIYVYIEMDAHFFKEMQDTLLTLCPSKWWPNPVHNGAYQAWKKWCFKPPIHGCECV